MNCDRVASAYRWMEYLRFGASLEKCRFALLPQVIHSRNALLLGDGDGRFLTALAKLNRTVQIDSVDASKKMLAISRKRVQRAQVENEHRIRLQRGDVRSLASVPCQYDLIASHFFFDVFPAIELKQILDRVAERTVPGALWLVSEFDVPDRGWRRLSARFWLKIMYWLFRLTTGLRNQRLPDWRTLLTQAGFVRQTQKRLRGGFVVSELWQRTD